MSREWKPGDVAVRTYYGRSYLTIATDSGCHGGGLHWHHVVGGWDPIEEVSGPAYRPLVVIDPEDRSQVERLAASLSPALALHGGHPVLVWETMQQALREFANPTPPKPEEPTGLGAVVEDADGAKWVSHRDGPDHSRPWLKHMEGDLWSDYADIAAVKVLSEGIQ